MKEIKTKSCENYDIYSMYNVFVQRANYGLTVRWIKTGKSFMVTAADGRKCRWTL